MATRDGTPGKGLWNTPGALEVTVRGGCTFTRAPRVRLVETVSGRPIPGVKVQLSHGTFARDVITGPRGEIPLPGEGYWTLSFEGDLLHLPCKDSRTFVLGKKGKGRSAGWIRWIFLGASFFLMLVLFRERIRGLFRRSRGTEEHDEFTEEGYVRISSGRFGLGHLFGHRRWAGLVVDWKGEQPLEGAVVQWEGHSQEVDSQGRFLIDAKGIRLTVHREGYKSQTVSLNKDGGEVIVKMISLRHWALFLLKRIFEGHDPALAHAMTPREGLERQIPPPEVIARLEALAYGRETPEEGELERFRELLGQGGSHEGTLG